MALARVKIWNPGDILTAADQNGEFNNVLNNALTLISPLTGNLNVNQFQMLGARLENLTADPAAANIGRVWGNTAAGSVGVDFGSSQQGSVTFPVCSVVEAGCRLVAVTSSQSALNPFKSNKIPIKTGTGWQNWTLPSTGLTLSSTALAIVTSSGTNTMFYVYAFNNAGTLALANGTSSGMPHATSTETGVEVASTDATRTLVGMVFTATSTAAGFPFFVGPPGAVAPTGIGTLSWYNRQDIGAVAGFTALRTQNTTSYAEINAEIRVPFLTWGTEVVDARVNGSCVVTSGNSLTMIGFDGNAAEDAQAACASLGSVPLCLAVPRQGLTEGGHFATLMGAALTPGFVNTWNGAVAPSGTTPTARTVLNVRVRG